MTRKHPPQRRPSITAEVVWQGHPFTITSGLDPATGNILDVFADTPKGGQMQATLADACVLISIALQHGVPLHDLSKSLARVPVLTAPQGFTAPASPVGAIVDALMQERLI